MKIGLAYDLKSAVPVALGTPDEEAEEYDPPSTIDALASEIERLGHQLARLGGGPEFLKNVGHTAVDFVFNIAEGRGIYRSREAQIPGVLEMLGIPYFGSDPLTLGICLDKPSAKLVALSAGVLTPQYHVVRQIDELSALRKEAVDFPLVVKPAFEGSSKGVHPTSLVDNWDDLYQAVETALEAYRQPALVEEFVPGTEVTVGLLGNNPPRVLGVMEVVPQSGPNDNFMYTLEVKRDWRNLVSYRVPPALPAGCVREIEATALTLFAALGCRDVARMDFRIARNGNVYFLEANPLPGLGDYSDLPIMASIVGRDYSWLIENLLNSALERCGLSPGVCRRDGGLGVSPRFNLHPLPGQEGGRGMVEEGFAAPS